MNLSDELEKKKKEINSLCEEFFSLSKKDIEKKEKLIAKITNLENEIQTMHSKLNRV